MKSKKTLSILFVVYASLLLLASILPAFGALNKAKVDLLFELRFDYFIHFCAYFGFYFLLIISNFSRKFIISKKEFLFFVVLTLLFSIVTEIIQHFLSYRTFNPLDMLSNVLGVVLGILFYKTFLLRLKQKNP